MSKKNKKKKPLDMTICDGIEVSQSIYRAQGNRMKMLIFRGIMIYLLSAGGICGILSASGTKHWPLLINLVLLISALYLSCIHISKRWETIGNSIFLVFISVFGFGLSLYMNTGFYAVLNDINEKAKSYFDYTGIRTYAEVINNRVLAVNIAAIALGVLCNFLFNIWVSRMMYMDAFLLVMIMLVYPAYVQCEPDLIYVVMVICSTAMAYILRRAGQGERTSQMDWDTSESQSEVAEDEKIKTKKSKGFVKRTKEKKEEKHDKKITYRYNMKAYVATSIQVIVIVFVIVMIMQVVIPKKSYYAENKDTQLKTQTKEQVGTFVRQGFAGFFSFYDNIAGMGDGRLGGVGIVSLDYNTDFILRFTPYSEDTLYLKGNSYVDYFPYENRWMRLEESISAYEVKNYRNADENEAITLKKAYESEVLESLKDRKTAKGNLHIENVGLYETDFMPYYTIKEEMKLDTADNGNDLMKIKYYPRTDKNETKVKQAVNLTPYLRYSEDNEESLAKLVKDAGIKDGMEVREVVGLLAAHFQKEFPYTLNPGIVPYKEDFVNYFINEHQKGYCAHFATTATLVFRYMGIPARYVEGYAVQFDEVLNGTVLQKEKYKDYYDGHSELGETGVIEVEVSDASAHAWVEIYIKDYGWVPVEVTPSAANEVGGSGGFWNRFMGIFSGGNQLDRNSGNDNSDDTNAEEREDFLASDLFRTIVVLAVGVLFVFIVVMFVKTLIYRSRYRKANINDRLILDYSRLYRKRCRRHYLLRDRVNYKEQVDYMYTQRWFRMPVDENVVASLVDILHRAGFSDKLISADEDRFVRDILGL